MIQANFPKLLRKMISIAAAITIKFSDCSRKRPLDDQKVLYRKIAQKAPESRRQF